MLDFKEAAIEPTASETAHETQQTIQLIKDGIGQTTFAAAQKEVCYDHLAAKLAEPEMRNFMNAYARKLTGRKAQAEDLCSETTLRLLKKFHGDGFNYRSQTELRGYISMAMRNLFLSSVRTQYRESDTIEDYLDIGSIHIDENAARPDLMKVMNFIGTLPKGQRDALMLHVTGEEYESVAEKLGVELGTIKSRVSRARETLAKKFPEFADFQKSGHRTNAPRIRQKRLTP